MGEKMPATGMPPLQFHGHVPNSMEYVSNVPNIALHGAKKEITCQSLLDWTLLQLISPPLTQFNLSPLADDMSFISPRSIHSRGEIASSGASIFEIEVDSVLYAMKVVRAHHVS